MMEKKENTAKKVARGISKLLHPFIVLAVAVAIVAAEVSPSFAVWAKWTMAALIPAYLFPLAYMQTKLVIVTRSTGAQMTLRSFFRERPNELLLIACLFALPNILLLYSLSSPNALTATMVSVGLTALMVSLANRIYRVSIHLSMIISLAIPLMVIARISPLLIASIILLLGLARYYLGEHTPVQLLAGFLLGLVVTTGVFYCFGFLPVTF